MNNLVFEDKGVAEVVPLVVNFSDKLQFGEAINGANVTVSVISGTDPTPSAILSGGPTFTATTISQNITGGVVGVLYAVAFLATGTNSHNYLKVGSLAVVGVNPF